MSHPFQCLHYCSRRDQEKYDILIAASGSCIFCFDIASGKLISVWTSPLGQEQQLNNAIEADSKGCNDASSNDILNFDAERPSKRQRVFTTRNDSGGASTNPMLEDGRDLKADLPEVPGPSTAVIKLLGTNNGQFIVFITDDKTVRVLEFLPDNTLKQVSERPMPKRPCAIILTPDESTILCADKFGDVYSLPLLGRSDEGFSAAENGLGKPLVRKDEVARKPFVPAANTKTVHTLRNREALRHQQTQTNILAKSKSSTFEHRLLLGHVCMLTDLLCISISENILDSPHERTYIFTSDRDEHIRVSRGMPQAHIIEGFCLGHTEFVSKLCIPRWQKQLLISGGGDNYLLTWNWLSGEILQKVDLKNHLDEFRRHSNPANDCLSTTDAAQDISREGANRLPPIAVSGIWAVDGLGAKPGNFHGEVVVACEGVPALFMFHLGSDLKLIFRERITLPGNLLDVAVVNHRCMIIYSLDNIHIPFSTTVMACMDDKKSIPLIGSLILDSSGHWKKHDILQDAVAGIESEVGSKAFCIKQKDNGGRTLSSLFYGIENLRKRGQEESE